MKLIVQLGHVFLAVAFFIHHSMMGQANIHFQYQKSIPSVPFVIQPLSVLQSIYPEILYQKVYEKYPYEYTKFVVPEYKVKGCCDELFVLDISNALLFGTQGHLFIENNYIQELVWAEFKHLIASPPIHQLTPVFKVFGKIAVIAQTSCNNYVHFMQEVLGRLAILELAGAEYDYLFIPYCEQFAFDLLSLWGIDLSKVFYFENPNCFIQADHVIVPSMVINKDIGFNQAGICGHPIVLKYVQQKLLKAALAKQQSNNVYSKRIFISRKDAPVRKIINEDELFALCEPYGFVRYEMGKLSVIDQILIGYNAEIVVAEHGAGLANILFSKPGTKVVELFQAHLDPTFWWMANVANLDYHPILMTEGDFSYIANLAKYPDRYAQTWRSILTVSPEPLRKCLQTLGL